jgi:hypothetical protein
VGRPDSGLALQVGHFVGGHGLPHHDNHNSMADIATTVPVIRL